MEWIRNPRICRDREVRAIEKVVKLLVPLSERARERVLRHLWGMNEERLEILAKKKGSHAR